MSLLLLLSTVAAYSPIALPEFQVPSTMLVSRYATDGHVVDIAMDTSLPSLNLDNVPGVRKIRCDPDFVRVTLSDLSPTSAWAVSDDGLLLQIGPQWKCDLSGSTVFRKALSMHVRDNTAYFYAKRVNMRDVADKIDVSVGMSQEFDKDLNIDWNVDQMPLVQDARVRAQCTKCGVQGGVSFHVQITKKHPMHVPKVNALMKGNFNMNMDVKVTKSMLSALDIKSFELFRKDFPRIDVAGVVTIDPYFLVTAGFSLPEGPINGFMTGFEVNAPEFAAELVGHNKTLSTDKTFHPELKGHGFSIEPARYEESDVTAVVTVSPKMMLDLHLFNQFDVAVGLGAPVFVEGNVQTGSYATECQEGQTKLSMRIGASLKGYLAGDENALGPFTKKQVFFQCK